MKVARQGQGTGRLPGREPIEPGMEEERLGDEQGEREQRPDDHHRVHPPESDRIREPPPRVEVANEPLPTGLARTAGDRARAASTEGAPSTRVLGMMPRAVLVTKTSSASASSVLATVRTSTGI